MADVHGQIALSRWTFASTVGRPLNDIRDEKIPAADVRFVERNWLSRREYIQRLLLDATEIGAQLGLAMPKTLQEEHDLVEKTEAEAKEALAHVAEALEARQKRDTELAEFFAQSEKLCRWCREQLANMDTMTEPDHVQEFCGALIESYPTMSSNFSLLLKSVEPYVKANYTPVCKALREANELWFYLQVTTLERLSRILYEIHPTSPLEAEVRKYANFPAMIAKFEGDVRALIHSAPPSAESNSLLLACDEVAPLTTQYKGLSKEAMDFAERNQICREGYRCLRAAILSRLTYIDATDAVVLESKRRQQEFEDSVKELKKWAADVAHGESWRDIYSKIVEVKRLIKEEQNVLDELNMDGIS
ncbi:hypothetical protein, conserved [Angomonas deanei]|uniref:Uncharacterized protein n=1 Tax=Angomonas deanei TaxID=59799 RepID=A0A7G2C400_9TRYP|nr:hypothetical protein, conserved [Angomonas deanei]